MVEVSVGAGNEDQQRVVFIHDTTEALELLHRQANLAPVVRECGPQLGAALSVGAGLEFVEIVRQGESAEGADEGEAETGPG